MSNIINFEVGVTFIYTRATPGRFLMEGCSVMHIKLAAGRHALTVHSNISLCPAQFREDI